MTLTQDPARLVEESCSPLLASPPGWPRAPLGEVATILNGFAFSSKQFLTEGGMPLIRIRDIFSSSTSTRYVGPYEARYVVHRGDLLVGMDGDFNCARWSGPDALLNQRVCKIVPHADHLDLDYVTVLLPAYLQAIHDATSSTTVTHLSSLDIARLPIPVPALTDQRTFVSVVGAISSMAAAGASHVRQAQVAIERFRKSVLQAACSGRLTADWREATVGQGTKPSFAAHLKAVSSLVDTPPEWSWFSLGDLADIQGGIQVGASRRTREPMRAVPYLRVANVQQGRLDLSEIKTIMAPENAIAALRLRPGDILFNEGGDRDKLGRGWVWEGQIEECIHQNHVFRARLLDERMQPRFYSWYGNSIGMAYFYTEAKQTVNLASLSKTKLSQMPVPAPPIEEQEEIVLRVDRLLGLAEELDSRVKSAAQAVSISPQAVLAKALRGELSGVSA